MYSLGIVQARITQFDGPLFRKLASQPDFTLAIYLTDHEGQQNLYDPELKHASGWDIDIISGYTHYILPSNKIGQYQAIRKMIMAGHDLVIVSGYSSVLLLMTAILGKIYGVPIGLRLDSILLYRKMTSWKWLLKDRVLPILYKLYRTFHPVGNLTRSMLLKYGVSSESMFLFPYAVDNEFLRGRHESAIRERGSIRSQAGIPDKALVILGVLKFIQREDPQTLLMAYHQLVKEFPDVHLILVGDGHLRKNLEEYIRQHGLNQTHLPGYVPYSHLPKYFAIADVFVHPAKAEPWGVTVNEALACGLPVIAADTVGAAYDLIEKGVTGLIFQAGNVESLTEQLKDWLTHHSRDQFTSQRAIERMSHWSYDLTVGQLRSALEHVSSKKGCFQGDKRDKS